MKYTLNHIASGILPGSYSLSIILGTIDEIAKQFGHKFRFGYLNEDDIEQQARLIGWQALESYDWKRPLENFLRVHIRNRLINFKRDNYRRLEPPCPACPYVDTRGKTENGCLKFTNKLNCDKWEKYMARSESKQNLMNPLPIIESIDKGREDNRVEHQELLDKIDRELGVEYRGDFLKLMAGVKIPKGRKDILLEKVKEILGGNQEG